MGDIQFDAADASALARVARRAADTLRAQAGPRADAVATALADSDGSYADRFRDAAVVEAEDRARLAGVLSDLAGDVDAAIASAERERARQRAHKAWKDREAERQRTAATVLAGTLSDAVVDSWGSLVDPEPSTEPVPRPVADAEFRGRERARFGNGPSRGRSSADPAALRAFVVTVAGLDTAVTAESQHVRTAWTAFTRSCRWVDVDRGSMPAGFERYVAENDEDRAWIGKVAKAFEDAGGGGPLADVALDIAAVGQAAPAIQGLFAEGLTAEQVAERWARLGLTKADAGMMEALPVNVLTRLGNLEGVPYWARSSANEVVLNQRLGDVEQEITDAERALLVAGTAVPKVLLQLASLREERRSLRNINAAIRERDFDGPRFLIGLTEDHPPLAAVSIGDLDVAKSVTWAVPGMDTTTAGMTTWTTAAQNIYDEQGRGEKEPDQAVIAWIGYEAPSAATVLGMAKAEAGGRKLAASIQGLGAVRAGAMPTTNVVAHSYGTTTAAVALSETGAHVDRFVALGSAGLPNEIDSAGKLHAEHVYVGQARNVAFDEAGQGDHLASLGRTAPGHHVDPASSVFGGTTFGTDSNPAEATEQLPVLTHDPVTENEDASGYLDANTESIYNVGRVTTGHESDATPFHPRPPTERDQRLHDQLRDRFNPLIGDR